MTNEADRYFDDLELQRNLKRRSVRGGFMTHSAQGTRFIAGLRFGPVWVAASYALTSVCLRTPLVLWFDGRRGPVGVADLYRTLLFPGGFSLVVLAALVAMRIAAPDLGPVVGLIVTFVVAAAIVVLALVLLPAGKRRVREARQLLRYRGKALPENPEVAS